MPPTRIFLILALAGILLFGGVAILAQVFVLDPLAAIVLCRPPDLEPAPELEPLLPSSSSRAPPA